MATSKTRVALFVAVPLLILMLPVAVYLVDRAATSGEVPRNVSIAGVPVGGLSEQVAIEAVERYESELAAAPAAFAVNGRSFELEPATVGFEVDAEGAVARAMTVRDTGLISGFRAWFQSFNDEVDLSVDVTVDEEAINEHLDDWEQDAIPNPAYEGDIGIRDGEVYFEYPVVGLALDKVAAGEIVAAVLRLPERETTDLPLRDSVPRMTRSEIDAAVSKIDRIIGGPVTLRDRARGFFLTLSGRQMAEALRVEVVENSPPTIQITLDQDTISAFVEPRRAEFEVPPVDAAFDVDLETNEVTIIPSLNGTVVDIELISEALFETALSDAPGDLPLAESAEPEFSTADSEGFGPLGLVSEFTTKHACCAARVHNIQLMADTIDGYIVWPGEEFSINDRVGRRTTEGGYRRDGAIIGGEIICCDSPANVGGGVSQFGTTFYNAVFYGCYEDILHTPHSIYISRYPEGREATLGYPLPDVRFGNDSEAPVIIRTEYTGRSITVKFFGNNGGRICTAEKSDRSNFSRAKERRDPNPDVAPGSERIVSKGSGGWSVTIVRVIEFSDGRIVREPFTHHYRGGLRVIEVHPCELGGSECPLQVPGVIGASHDGAIGSITSAGFTFGGATTTESCDFSQKGLVIDQSLGAGTWHPAGSAVAITVCDAPEPPPEEGEGGE